MRVGEEGQRELARVAGHAGGEGDGARRRSGDAQRGDRATAQVQRHRRTRDVAGDEGGLAGEQPDAGLVGDAAEGSEEVDEGAAEGEPGGLASAAGGLAHPGEPLHRGVGVQRELDEDRCELVAQVARGVREGDRHQRVDAPRAARPTGAEGAPQGTREGREDHVVDVRVGGVRGAAHGLQGDRAGPRHQLARAGASREEPGGVGALRQQVGQGRGAAEELGRRGQRGPRPRRQRGCAWGPRPEALVAHREEDAQESHAVGDGVVNPHHEHRGGTGAIDDPGAPGGAIEGDREAGELGHRAREVGLGGVGREGDALHVALDGEGGVFPPMGAVPGEAREVDEGAEAGAHGEALVEEGAQRGEVERSVEGQHRGDHHGVVPRAHPQARGVGVGERWGGGRAHGCCEGATSARRPFISPTA